MIINHPSNPVKLDILWAISWRDTNIRAGINHSIVLTTCSTKQINFSQSITDSPSDTAQYCTRIKDRHPQQNFLGFQSCGRDYLCPFTKPPLPKRVGSLAAALLISWTRWVKGPCRGIYGSCKLLPLNSSDCTLVLYKQLMQTGFGCYSSDFTLSRAFHSMRTQTLGEPPHTSSIALQ